MVSFYPNYQIPQAGQHPFLTAASDIVQVVHDVVKDVAGAVIPKPKGTDRITLTDGRGITTPVTIDRNLVTESELTTVHAGIEDEINQLRGRLSALERRAQAIPPPPMSMGGGGMNNSLMPLMLVLLLGNSSSSTSGLDTTTLLLLVLAMSGGLGGGGGGGMDMTTMLLLLVALNGSL